MKVSLDRALCDCARAERHGSGEPLPAVTTLMPGRVPSVMTVQATMHAMRISLDDIAGCSYEQTRAASYAVRDPLAIVSPFTMSMFP